MAKMLSARFGPGAGGRRPNREPAATATTTTEHLNGDGRRFFEHHDKDGWLDDKRKLARMSREERIRQLILRHGGKNVSTAIRFLASELEKQKQSLFHSLVNETNNKSQNGGLTNIGQDEPDEQAGHCECACHHHYQANDNHEIATTKTTPAGDRGKTQRDRQKRSRING